MKLLIFPLSLCCSLTSYCQTKTFENDSMIIKVDGHDTTFLEKPFRNDPHYVYVDDPKAYPSFKGDISTFIQQHLDYPRDARDKKIEGVVRVDVHINEAGKIDDSLVLNTVSPSIDAEALRIVLLMKDWQPAELNGHICDMWRTVSVSFTLK